MNTEERRAWVRHRCRLSSHGIHKDPLMEVCWQGIILDISQGGAKLLLNRRFEPGAKLEIEFDSSSEHPPCRAKVVHGQAHTGGGWLVGCQFETVLTEAQLQDILDSQLEAVL